MNDYIVGVDEVGRGSLVGSAVVCAFRSDDEFFQTLPFDIVDSKKISHKKRQLIYDFFTSNKSLNEISSSLVSHFCHNPSVE